MTKEQELLKNLEAKIENINHRVIDSFKKSGQDLKTFFAENKDSITREFATASTEALHSGITNGLSSPEFTQSVIQTGNIGAYNLQLALYHLAE